jgi:Domain of Unknown Function (DUF928)
MFKQTNQHKNTRSTVLLTTMLCVGFMSLSAEFSQAGTAFNPPGGSAPNGRGGASRGEIACSSNPGEFSRRFLPLTPIDSKYGLTVSERPTFFVNIPPSSAQKAFFSLKDAQGKIYYQTVLPINKQGGIMRIDLPLSTAPLTVNQPYQWGIAALCSGKLKPDSPFVSSWVKRVALSTNLASQLAKATPIDRAALYSTNGIWYDTLTTLVDTRQETHNNATLLSTWSTLLTSVGLGDVATQTLP